MMMMNQGVNAQTIASVDPNLLEVSFTDLDSLALALVYT
jgi:hypothetical protein